MARIQDPKFSAKTAPPLITSTVTQTPKTISVISATTKVIYPTKDELAAELTKLDASINQRFTNLERALTQVFYSQMDEKIRQFASGLKMESFTISEMRQELVSLQTSLRQLEERLDGKNDEVKSEKERENSQKEEGEEESEKEHKKEEKSEKEAKNEEKSLKDEKEEKSEKEPKKEEKSLKDEKSEKEPKKEENSQKEGKNEENSQKEAKREKESKKDETQEPVKAASTPKIESIVQNDIYEFVPYINDVKYIDLKNKGKLKLTNGVGKFRALCIVSGPPTQIHLFSSQHPIPFGLKGNGTCIVSAVKDDNILSDFSLPIVNGVIKIPETGIKAAFPWDLRCMCDRLD
jgi:hypothetical protein